MVIFLGSNMQRFAKTDVFIVKNVLVLTELFFLYTEL